MKILLPITILACLVLIPAGSPLHAGWTENGHLVGLNTCDQNQPRLVPDGDGGCFITWYDDRTYTDLVYVQRIDRHGNELWVPGGISVCTSTLQQNTQYIIPDGNGNVILVWKDSRPSADIYAQMLDSDGNRLWDPAGVPVLPSTAGVYLTDICTDGNGGVIITWYDGRDSNFNVYAQRHDHDGVQMWAANGVEIDVSTGDQLVPRLAPDGSGGAIITWMDPNGISRIKAQRLSQAGTKGWGSNGVAICSHSFTILTVEIVSDGAGGAVIAWTDYRNGNYDVFAQRVMSTGSRLWITDGITVCSASGTQRINDMVPDGEWGAVVVWDDDRNATNGEDIYAQRIDGWGYTQWTANGVPVYTGQGDQDLPRIDSDGAGGYFVAWRDMRSAVELDVFSTRINQSGLANWATDKGEVCTAISDQSFIEMTNDGEGNLLLVWRDERGANTDVYMQRMDASGYWGDPAPSIAAVRDVPDDQGGSVNVAWDASRLDVWPEDEIDYYSVWRAIDELQAMLMMKAGIPMLSSASEAGPGSLGSLRTQLLAGETYYWTQVASVNSSEIVDEYSVQVETLFDSVSVDSEYHYFQVAAHGTGLDMVWASVPDSGRSVDNLAPCPPLALAGEQTYDPGGLQLTWSPNVEEDMDYYVIHRGLSEKFLPGRFSFLANSCDTTLIDDDWDWAEDYWYKVAAVDIHGNMSAYSVLGPDKITGDDPMPLPDATFLAQNFPNPFNPSTTIAFGLKTGGFVNLTIYDAAGRLVATLINESRPAGQYAAVWNGNAQNGSPAASGVYFYQLKAGIYIETKKMILLK